MLTQRNDQKETELSADPRSNTTLTLDGLVRPSDSWTLTYLASASRDNSWDSVGFSGSIYAGWTPNNWYWGWLSQMVDEKYEPGMGFVFGKNIVHHNPGGYYIWRPAEGWFSKWIRRADPGFFVNWYQTASDLATQEFSLEIFPVYVFTKSNALITYTITPTWQNFAFPISILGNEIQAGQYKYVRHQLYYRSDQSKKLSVNGSLTLGEYYNGKLQSARLGGRFAPVPHFALDLSYELNHFENFGSESKTFSTNLYSAGIRLAASPRLQVSGFYQYNSFDKLGRFNVRGSWEFAPLSFVYLVFNQNNYDLAEVKDRSLISKITYLKQF